MASQSNMVGMAMAAYEDHREKMGDEMQPLKNEEEEQRLQVKEVGDTRFFISKAWSEILISVYTMLRTLLQLFLDISLCLSYFKNGDIAWFTLTTGIMVASNLVCFFWMLSIQYGSNRFRDIEVLIDDERKPRLGLADEIKNKFKSLLGIKKPKKGAIETHYHVLPNYRVFYFEDNPAKVYNISLPRPPPLMSLRFRGWCLPLLALIAQLPTYLEYEYLKWRRMALISLKRNGRKYHEKMVKCVFMRNILQMVLIVSFGERAFQLFLQLYIVTHGNHGSPLQLSQILLGFFGMLFSCIYVQTICSYMNRNLWENGFKAYLGSLSVYISMILLALTSLVVIFIYAAIYDEYLAFISFAIFLVFLLSHFTRGLLIRLRPIIVPISKFLFWILFGIFCYSNFSWHKCMTNFNDFTSMDYVKEEVDIEGSNTTIFICPGARIRACNLTAIESSISTSWSFSLPFICASVYYDKLYFIINIVPYVILLFAFMSPLHKGFEYYYDYKPRILPGEDDPNDDADGIEIYYKELKRKLADSYVIISVVQTKNSATDNGLATVEKT